MLTVKTPDEALETILSRFKPLKTAAECVKLSSAIWRVLHDDVTSSEYVPGFDRSTVDGYAVIAADTFGCSSAIPAVLTLSGEVLMGKAAQEPIAPGTCVAVSTGGDLPEGTDAVVMLEHTEDYGEGLIGITQPAAPGSNIIFKGDDVSPGDIVLRAGTRLSPHDIGILSALGITSVIVRPWFLIGIISTGDELVEPDQKPGGGQVRDVNTPMLGAFAQKLGAAPVCYGIIRDNEQELRDIVARAVAECDIVLISGGSSAGMRDLTAKVIESEGELLFHGIAMKPGKPTILGDINGKPVFGLPGHPVAAYFVTELFVRPLTAHLLGSKERRYTVQASLSEAISSNHGRAEYIAVVLSGGNGDEPPMARPIRGKSGLIASLSGTDGYICIPRDCEGLAKGATIAVTLW